MPMRPHRVLLCWLAMTCSFAPLSRVGAQASVGEPAPSAQHAERVSPTPSTRATVITIAPRSPFAARLADRLSAGLSMDVTHAPVTVTSAVPDCAAQATTEDTSVTVALTTSRVVHLCARSGSTIVERDVGPLTALDAAAVEEIATVVEATLEALVAPEDATSSAPTDASPQADATAEPAPDTAQAANASTPQTDVETAPPSATQSPIANEGAPTEPAPSPAAEPIDAPANDYTLGLGYELAAWDRAFVHGIRVAAERRLYTRWFWVEGGLLYNVPFDVDDDSVGATFAAIAFDLRVSVHWQLVDEVELVGAFGPRLEWLMIEPFVPPFSGGTAEAFDNETTFTFDTVVELGSRVRVATYLWLSLRVGAVFVPSSREYGYYQDDAFVTVLDHGQARAFLHVGALLAL